MNDTHTWAVEFIEGGPDGGDDFYRCMTCGCSGGGTTGFSFKGRIFHRGPDEPPARMEVYDRKPSPFLPGPALELSKDCATAHEQISFFVHGYLRSWQGSIASNGRPAKDPLEESCFQLLVEADRYTPKAVPRVAFYRLVSDLHHEYGRKKISIAEARVQLVGLGFKLASPACTKCGRHTTRPGDDKNELCYSCADFNVS
jgi:hypothetical protein